MLLATKIADFRTCPEQGTGRALAISNVKQVVLGATPEVNEVIARLKADRSDVGIKLQTLGLVVLLISFVHRE